MKKFSIILACLMMFFLAACEQGSFPDAFTTKPSEDATVPTAPSVGNGGLNTDIMNPTTDPSDNGYADPFVPWYEEGTLVFNIDGVARLYGANGVVIKTYTGWDTETYEYCEAPWYNDRASIEMAVTEDGVSPQSTDYWFCNCTSLTNVTIGNGVIGIGVSAFDNCTSLISVSIPDSVISIDYKAFYGCTRLTSIAIPESVTSIGAKAFECCIRLTYITIPDGVTSIEKHTFYQCSSLTDITISDSVTSIGYESFFHCISLTEIVIPESVTSIDYGAFKMCTSLTDVTIPDSVTSIDAKVFYYCPSLSCITIPDSVTSIGKEAFYSCTNLTSITFEGTMTQWNKLQKGGDWDGEVPATKVVCSDGTVSL